MDVEKRDQSRGLKRYSAGRINLRPYRAFSSPVEGRKKEGIAAGKEESAHKTTLLKLLFCTL